jgi:Zinc knuckle.
MEEYDHRKVIEWINKKEDTALSARAKADKFKHTGKSKLKCYGCGEIGHIKRNCKKEKLSAKKDSKKENNSGSKDKSKESVAVTKSDDESDSDESEEALACLSWAFEPEYAHVLSSSRGPKVVINCGASRHFCSKKEIFEEFVSIDPKPILAADGRTFKR